MPTFTQPVGGISKITVTGTLTNVIALTTCRQIFVTEDPTVGGYPTSAFVVTRPFTGAGASNQRQMAPGTIYTFSGPFIKGQVAGQIKVTSGSTTFIQDEQ